MTSGDGGSLCDGLTGLGNRVLLAQMGDEDSTSGRVLVIVDLDDFKSINDTFGHATGDLVLQAVADVLRAAACSEDVLVRLGDDEFGALLTDAKEAAGHGLADRFLSSLEDGVEVNGYTIFVGASVAIAAVAPREPLTSAMRRADASMYHAKSSSNGDKVSVFDAGRDRQVLDDFALGSELRGALARDEFILHYQPIIDMGTRQTVGFEALVRWQRPGLGLVYPSAFIPLAEQRGLMPELGEWILEQACREASTWQAQHGKVPYVSVNLSVHQLQDPDFAVRFQSALEASQLPPERLIVEITETVMASESGAIAPSLDRLRRLGVRVYVDDFGTGYSSLGYIRDLPLDGVKLDRAFARDLITSADAWALARAIVALFQDLKLAVTAEGIESAAQLAQLRSLGCVHAQGFYFARPGPPHATCDLSSAGASR
ncbi:MAG: bifunctional diguanylate cyclase/phosphodiesterase [Actinomycetota bacterium]|nr:bifunctional diguanylate cyclase/phosphodiesterase [Actinomycetota bacterium]